MPPNVMRLGRMVDLVIGSPDAGSVNFSLLHSLLRAMVKHLGVVDVEGEVIDEAEEVLRRTKATMTNGLDQPRKKDCEEERDGRKNGKGKTGATKEGDAKRERGGGGNGGEGEEEGGGGGEGRRVMELERKVEKLEEQWRELNSFPSNGDLVDKMRRRRRRVEEETEMEEEGGGERRKRPVSDMWVSVQLSKKVEANTEGVSKSLALIEDLFHEMESLRRTFDQLDQETKKELDRIISPINKTESRTLLSTDHLDATQTNRIQNPMTNNNYSQTTMERTKSRLSTPAADIRSGVKAEELEELVERIGKLTGEQETTKLRLDQLEIILKEKADRTELNLLGEELEEKMTILFGDIDKLRRSEKESVERVIRMDEMLSELRKSVNHFQESVDQLTEATQRLSQESINHQNHLETLFCSCKELNEKKADKDFVENEVAIRASIKHLDEKVSCQNFDSTCDDINNTINDIVNKLIGHEDDWKKTMTHLNSAVDSKLDRLEFGPFRDELERQLRLIARKMAAGQEGEGGGGGGKKGELTDDEAAGFRKQLIQTFHCISCNKPLDMKSTQRTVPCLPSIPGLPETRSLRPHTVFELNQIRQLAHSHGNNQQQQQQSASQIQDLLDECNSRPRFCGGSHTLTYPHRRITKLSVASHLNLPSASLPLDNPPQPPSSRGGGEVPLSSSKPLPNVVHSSSSGHKSSSSTSVKFHRPQQHQPRVSRSLQSPVEQSPLEQSPLEEEESLHLMGDHGAANGTSRVDKEQSSRARNKRERSRVSAIAAMEEKEEEEEEEGEEGEEAEEKDRPEAEDRRSSFLSSSVARIIESETSDVIERSERTPPPLL